jgi:ABC-type transport system substrate-binding protein
LIEMMAEIGIDMYIENVPSSELFGSYANGAFRKHGQYDVLMYTTSYGIDPQSHTEGYFASTHIPCDDNSGRGYNYSRWIDDEFDEYIQIAGTSPDINERAEAYQKAGERVAEGRPHIYLYDRMEINVHVEDLMGWENNTWETIAWCADSWYLK